MDKSNQPDKDKSLDPYPTGGPLSLRQAMNRLFDESIWDPFDRLGGFWPATYQGIGFPRADICEDDKEVTVTAEVPGIDPDKVEIEVDEDTLTISGETERGARKKAKSFSGWKESTVSFAGCSPCRPE